MLHTIHAYTYQMIRMSQNEIPALWHSLNHLVAGVARNILLQTTAQGGAWLQTLDSYRHDAIHKIKEVLALVRSLNDLISQIAHAALLQTVMQGGEFIKTVRSSSKHTVIGIVTEGIPDLLGSLNVLVNRIALDVLLQVVISIPLFYLHHNLFALGFVCGFIFDQQVRDIVDKVNIVYSAHRTLLERVLFFGGGGLLAILTMPTSMVIATTYYSSQWGERLYRSCLTRYQNQVEDDTPSSPIIDG